MLFNTIHYVYLLFTILGESFVNLPKLKVETLCCGISVNHSIGPRHDIFVAEEGIATHLARILVCILYHVASVEIHSFAASNLTLRNEASKVRGTPRISLNVARQTKSTACEDS